MTYKINECEQHEKELKKMRKSELLQICKRHYRVANFSEHGKWDLIGDILRAIYGSKTLKQCKGWS